ncbi:MAG: lysine--tRNA ligase [Patescibacteria group bacterium]
MATLKELREVRLQKLKKLKELGIDPYPARVERDTEINTILTKFDSLEGQTVAVAGRIKAMREHGKLAFIDLKDASGVIQLYIKEENLITANYSLSQLKFENLELLDMGDFIEAKGVVTKTQRGELSIEVTALRLLTKALRPLADKWEGLKDKETRLRRRYIDTNVNQEVFDRFVRRAKFWEAQREFLNGHGFLEINVPVLEHIPGGADATPFVTHMDAIDQDFFLRISHELQLKRLIGGGYEKVYEIGPRFRNEGLSDEHLPEHIAMEFYWAYADWEQGMQFVEDMFKYVIDKVYHKDVFEIRGFSVDFSKKWERIDFAEIMKKHYGINVYSTSVEEVSVVLKKHNIKIEFDMNVARGIDYLWKNLRKDIAGPAFLINHPKFLSPLSKSKVENPKITERCQPIIAGSELGNGWSELNDPLDQLDRFTAQQKLREMGDAEAQWLDIDYIEMLEYGMPPTFGWGHSERVFWFLEDVTAREGVPFPQLKFELDEVTREIYGDALLAASQYKESEEKEFLGSTVEKKVTAPKDLEPVAEGSLPLTVDSAKDLLTTNMENVNLQRHCLAVGYTLQALRRYYVENGREHEVGNLTEDAWQIVGVLHDADWEKTSEAPELHTLMLLNWLKAYEVYEEILNVFRSHNNKVTQLREPETLLEWSLECCDELTGFIAAVTLVRPSRQISDVKVSSVKKKFKTKEFARAVHREQISQCEEKLGISLDTFIEITLNAMKEHAEELGL